MTPMTQLPAVVVEAMCSRLHTEGLSGDVGIIDETQAIVTPASLQALAQSAFERRPPKPEAIQAILLTPLIPIAMPPKSCGRGLTLAEAARLSDTMVVQFSSPFVNPFARGQTGALARLSLGGSNATWYWVPLAYQNDRWMAGAPNVLSVTE